MYCISAPMPMQNGTAAAAEGSWASVVPPSSREMSPVRKTPIAWARAAMKRMANNQGRAEEQEHHTANERGERRIGHVTPGKVPCVVKDAEFIPVKAVAVCHERWRAIVAGRDVEQEGCVGGEANGGGAGHWEMANATGKSEERQGEPVGR